MRKWNHVILGIWHPYKKAAEVVWRHWLPSFFGPLFHEIMPAAKCFKQAKLRNIAQFFTLCRLAYPSFKTQLESAIASASVDIEHPEVVSSLNHLRDLLEFFIPVVLDFLSVCVIFFGHLIKHSPIFCMLRWKIMAVSSKWTMARRFWWDRFVY